MSVGTLRNIRLTIPTGGSSEPSHLRETLSRDRERRVEDDSRLFELATSEASSITTFGATDAVAFLLHRREQATSQIDGSVRNATDDPGRFN
jgi:hypothetical protein